MFDYVLTGVNIWVAIDDVDRLVITVVEAIVNISFEHFALPRLFKGCNTAQRGVIEFAWWLVVALLIAILQLFHLLGEVSVSFGEPATLKVWTVAAHHFDELTYHEGCCLLAVVTNRVSLDFVKPRDLSIRYFTAFLLL